jgi:hypothetical protein
MSEFADFHASIDVHFDDITEHERQKKTPSAVALRGIRRRTFSFNLHILATN